jgi:hypothetical protein
MIPFPALIYCASIITLLFLYYFSASGSSRKNSQTNNGSSANQKESRGSSSNKSGSNGSLNKVKALEASDIYRQVNLEEEMMRNSTPIMYRRRRVLHRNSNQNANLSEDSSNVATLKSASNSNLDESSCGDTAKKNTFMNKVVGAGTCAASYFTWALKLISWSGNSSKIVRSGSSILEDGFSFKAKKTQIEDNFKLVITLFYLDFNLLKNRVNRFVVGSRHSNF